MTKLSEYCNKYGVSVTITKHIDTLQKERTPKYAWVQCTPNNIKIGDEVRGIINNNCILTVKYILNGRNMFIGGLQRSKIDFLHDINLFEKKIKQ